MACVEGFDNSLPRKDEGAEKNSRGLATCLSGFHLSDRGVGPAWDEDMEGVGVP